MINYETLKEASKEVRRQTRKKCEVGDLIVLAQGNDPFYFGTDSDKEKAQWFADIWRKFGYTSGVHLRRIHYQIMSQDPPLRLPNGTPYENTEKCWRELEDASKRARYLEYVPAEAFVDRRNRGHQIFADMITTPADPSISVDSELDVQGLTIPEFPMLPNIMIDHVNQNGLYRDPYVGIQPYMLEIWAEKSTMDDVLLPLCQKYQANYVVSLGEQSITSALELVKRARAVKKPVRIFYISDFDPAGASMPVATARKIEYYARKYAPDADIQVEPIALTVDQCQTYHLPRTPIKEEERRKERFEERHGEGATELDALQALHPGALQAIVEQAILKYFDATLAQRVADERARLTEVIDEIEESVRRRHASELEAIYADYQAFSQDFADRMTDLQNRMLSLWHDMGNDLSALLPDITDFPVPTATLPKEEEWQGLYDSKRDYFAQLAAFKKHQGKPFKVASDISLN